MAAFFFLSLWSAGEKNEPTNEIIKTNQTLVIDLIEVNIDIVKQTEEKKKPKII